MTIEQRVIQAMDWTQPPPKPDLKRIREILNRLLNGEDRTCHWRSHPLRKPEDGASFYENTDPPPMPPRPSPETILHGSTDPQIGFFTRRLLGRINYALLIANGESPDCLRNVMRFRLGLFMPHTPRSMTATAAVQAAEADIAMRCGEPQEKWQPILDQTLPYVELLEAGCMNVRLHGKYSVYCFERPQIKLDNGTLHNPESGPSVWWRGGGASLYFWRGTYVGTHPLGSPSWERVHDRAMSPRLHHVELERLGWGVVIQAAREPANAHVILLGHARDEYGDLYHISIRNPWRELRYAVLQVSNATPNAEGEYETHYLCVPMGVPNPRLAVAWTYGIEPGDRYSNYTEAART